MSIRDQSEFKLEGGWGWRKNEIFQNKSSGPPLRVKNFLRTPSFLSGRHISRPLPPPPPYTILNNITVRPDQFNFREHGFFSKFEGSVGLEKKENKKKSQCFALALTINKSFF